MQVTASPLSLSLFPPLEVPAGLHTPGYILDYHPPLLTPRSRISGIFPPPYPSS